MMTVKRMHLTDLKTRIPFGAREKTLRLALKKDDIMNKWAQTKLAKRLKCKQVRRDMNDFERFKLYKAKKSRSKLVKKSLKPVKAKTTKKK